MVGIGRSIAYGINDLRYITGESVNKKHPEKISHVSDYFVSNEPDAMGVWQKMKFNMNRFGKLKNNVITLLLSPSAEHTRGYTKEDWKQLWDEFIQEFDQQELYDKEGKLYSEKRILLIASALCGFILNQKVKCRICMQQYAGETTSGTSTTTIKSTYVLRRQLK